MKRIVVVALVLISVFQGIAQEKKDKKDKEKWEVNKPQGPSREVIFTTNEGTWMCLDVSPDGKEIVFDMLGDIYIMPVTGGKARLLRSGLAWECQPRFSLDGSKISFTSDYDGGDNIWVMNRDGSDAHAITNEDFRLLNNAVWMPDGQYLVARKHFTSRRSLGAGEMWMYHISGGEGMQLTKRKNDQMDAGEPCISPDGKYVYFSEDMSPGKYFEYNKDPNKGIYVVRRVDLETGEIENIIGGPGGAVRPQISPDGELIAFVRRVRTKSVLYIHNLITGEEWPVYDKLDKDQQETWAIFGVYPNFSWTPDGNNIVFWAGGKIQKANIRSLEVTEIPFEAEVKQQIQEALHFDYEVHPETFEAKMIRNAVTSHDGKYLAFNALGRLWIKELPNGQPKRLTKNEGHFEYFPAFSPDGKYIAYAAWSDQDKGAIYKVKVSSGKAEKLTTKKGYYIAPSFSPDGSKIVYKKTTGNYLLGYSHSKEPGIYVISADGSTPDLLIESGSDPQFNADGTRIFFTTYEDKKRVLKSVDLQGTDEQSHFKGKYLTQLVPSPDNNWVAFTELNHCYIAPFPKTGKAVELSGKTKAIPVHKLTRDAGTSLHWSGDGQKVHWLLGPEYFTRPIKKSFKFVKGAPDSLPPVDTAGIKIGLQVKSDIPEGKLAFTGARIITMKGDEVIENGAIVIEKNRIVAVGKTDEITIPADANVYDVKGKTIIPGLVDVHAHFGSSNNGITPQRAWNYYAHLAYGVTTTHDPSNNTEMVFSQSEMVKSGALTGPRIFSTGTILYGADGNIKAVVNSLEDAKTHLRRMKAVGAFSVKSYNQPRRNQRQQVIKAARELEMLVYPEGGSFFAHNISMILDGHTGIEHSLPVAPLYKDVVELWSKSKTAYTPTLLVSYGGVWGENYWYQKTNLWENERMLKFTPRSIIDPRSRRRMLIPEDDFGHITNAAQCKKLADTGVKVQLGAHGQIDGIGAHWELWSLAQGGMSNMETLRASTLWGAEYIGMGNEIGSLEKGKLADLVVLDKNPLEDIQNTNSVKYVVQNGRMYDAENMNETGNYDKKRGKFFWEYEGYHDQFDWHSLSESIHKCGCFSAH